MGASSGDTKFTSHAVEATAYSSDWRSCGWEWGVALGPIPVYVPLCAGTRPSGSVARPFVPKRKREVNAPHKHDLLLGALCLSTACALGATVRYACSGHLGSAGRSAAGHLRLDKLLANRTVLGGILQAGAVGAGLGGTVFPVQRFWAETNLAGFGYAGTTCTGAFPKQARPAITRHNPIKDPVGFLQRLVTFRWRPRLGTIAADTTKVRVGAFPNPGTLFQAPL